MQMGPAHPPREIDPRRDVAPLIAAARLQLAAVAIEQMDEVVRLQQHVAEFGVAHSRLGVPLVAAAEPTLHRVLGQHHVHREVLADVPEEFEIGPRPGPLEVVHQQRPRPALLEVDELLHLPLHAVDVELQLLFAEQIPLGALAARIADHPCRPAHDGDRPMSRPLEPPEHHHAQQVAHVQAVGRRVEAGVERAWLFVEPGAKRRIGGLMDEAAPLEVCEEGHEEFMISDLGFLMWRGSWIPPTNHFAAAHHKSEILNHKSLIPRATATDRRPRTDGRTPPASPLAAL